MLSFFSGLPWKLIGYAAGALAIVALLLTINGWRVHAAERKAELQAICQATRAASGQPKLKCSEVGKQIKFMGEAISTLSDSLAKQNAAIAALGAESKRQQAEADKAAAGAAGRARAAEQAAERLRASARAGVPSGAAAGVCEPSKALSEAWK